VDNWVSHPDQVDALVAKWQAEYSDLLQVEHTRQYTGRPVWALTVTDRSMPDDNKKKAIIFKPHAHEPAPVAGQMNVMSQLLTGQTLSGQATALPRERYLSECLLCFMPDANPAGTAAAPVEAWDGTQYTNEEFWAWMRGVDPETGKMWKRVDLWDDTKEETLPTRYGIVYEQISEHEYVEPNRHERSSLHQWLKRLRDRFQWDRLLDLHQTEFVGQVENAMVILPAGYSMQSQERQEIETRWAQRLLQAWAQVDGGRPIMKAEPLNYGPDQLNYFLKAFGDVYQTCNMITSEIQNNSLLTPPPLQQKLNEVAIVETVEDMLEV